MAIEDSYLGVLGFSPSIFTSLVVIGAIVVVFAMVFAEKPSAGRLKFDILICVLKAQKLCGKKRTQTKM
ncbi:MAG: hypothetical protein Q6356_004085 [Candidatus Wukongarchaeota archaeon]|nr:hypothetical protein [Candidatus Wukongarchaeota archaeon]